MKNYCVVYLVCGTHYRYRCSAKNVREAKRQCINCMGCDKQDIVEVYTED